MHGGGIRCSQEVLDARRPPQDMAAPTGLAEPWVEDEEEEEEKEEAKAKALLPQPPQQTKRRSSRRRRRRSSLPNPSSRTDVSEENVPKWMEDLMCLKNRRLGFDRIDFGIVCLYAMPWLPAGPPYRERQPRPAPCCLKRLRCRVILGTLSDLSRRPGQGTASYTVFAAGVGTPKMY